MGTPLARTLLLSTLSALAIPTSVSHAGETACHAYETAPPEARTPEPWDAALTEASRNGDAKCEGILAIGLLARRECQTGMALANRVVASAPGQPLGALSRALAEECLLTTRIACEAGGRLTLCAPGAVAGIIDALHRARLSEEVNRSLLGSEDSALDCTH